MICELENVRDFGYDDEDVVDELVLNFSEDFGHVKFQAFQRQTSDSEDFGHAKYSGRAGFSSLPSGIFRELT